MSNDLENKLRLRKSRVRVLVTYGAALFLFGGGAIFVAFLIWTGQKDDALNLFFALIPVATGTIAFWFGGRGSSPEKEDKG